MAYNLFWPKFSLFCSSATFFGGKFKAKTVLRCVAHNTKESILYAEGSSGSHFNSRVCAAAVCTSGKLLFRRRTFCRAFLARAARFNLNRWAASCFCSRIPRDMWCGQQQQQAVVCLVWTKVCNIKHIHPRWRPIWLEYTISTSGSFFLPRGKGFFSPTVRDATVF